jgi:hypothetical protein
MKVRTIGLAAGKNGLSRVFACLAAGAIIVAASACTSNADAKDSSGAADSNSASTEAVATGPSDVATDTDPTNVAADSSTAGADPSESEMQSLEPASTAAPIPTPATTNVPAPGGGDINHTVADVPITTQSAVSADATVDLGGSVTANIVESKTITGVARGVGEVGGPAIELTIQIKNGSSAPIQLNAINVSVEDSASVPAGSLSGDPASPLIGTLESGASATGVFVFALPPSPQDPMHVAVSYAAGFPVALFAVSAK